MADARSPREQWGSGLGFILAAAGSAVGLGNIWKFPYITGQHGGGAFVLVYLLCIAAIGIPVMICEVTLGRHTQRNPVGAFRQLAPRSSVLAHTIGLLLVLTGVFLLAFKAWGWGVTALLIGGCVFRFGWVIVGALGVLAGFCILSFYSVVGGWTIGYIIKALSGQLAFDQVAVAKEHFGAFITNPGWAVGMHVLFMLSCIAIVAAGVKKGIERWNKILMPLLVLILLVLIVRAITLPGALAGVRFYLSPDFSKISATSVLVALGHAFFSLSLGMGAMMTYGSYVDKRQNLFTAVLWIVGADTLIALLAGLAIFPAVFARGFEPTLGPGLVFQVLPTVFHQIPLGPLWATLFFVLLFVAALTSGISLLEVVTAYFVDERGWSRHRAAWWLGGAITLLGVGCAISVADWSRLAWIGTLLTATFGSVKGSFFDVMDHVSSNWLLPIGGLFIALFVGWVWGTRSALSEIREGSHNFGDVHLVSLLAGLKDDPAHNARSHALTLASLWGIFVRFISPVLILVAFLYTIGWIDLKARPAPTPAAVEQPAP